MVGIVHMQHLQRVAEDEQRHISNEERGDDEACCSMQAAILATLLVPPSHSLCQP